MKAFLTGIFIVSALMTSAHAVQDTPNMGIPMDKGTLIEIGKYDEVTRIYNIIDVHNYGQGPWFTTPEQLAHAVSSLDLKRLLKDPKAIVSNQYTTDNLLLVVPDEVVEVLRKKLGKNTAPEKQPAKPHTSGSHP